MSLATQICSPRGRSSSCRPYVPARHAALGAGVTRSLQRANQHRSGNHTIPITTTPLLLYEHRHACGTRTHAPHGCWQAPSRERNAQAHDSPLDSMNRHARSRHPCAGIGPLPSPPTPCTCTSATPLPCYPQSTRQVASRWLPGTQPPAAHSTTSPSWLVRAGCFALPHSRPP